MDVRILGLAGSLRSSLGPIGEANLTAELPRLRTETELRRYLERQSRSGRAGPVRRPPAAADGDSGGSLSLTNSEVALAAGLWSAARTGAQVDFASLARHFAPDGTTRELDRLVERARAADGILLSTPVCFGDRGSLANDLSLLIRRDGALRACLAGKVYAGIAVGAKRNGGQETTLVYQLLDMVSCGMLGVGNDAATAAQYGGTCCAGDLGTAIRDESGMQTSMGTGRRAAATASLLRHGRGVNIRGKVKLMFWLLRDHRERARRLVETLTSRLAGEVEAGVIDVAGARIESCAACDVCPSRAGDDAEYRCVIGDEMEEIHPLFLNHDAVVPVFYSTLEEQETASHSQRFLERTRYLRRGDYLLSDCLTAPLVLEELGALRNMHVRLATAMIRHHTVLAGPMVAYLGEGRVLNQESVEAAFREFVRRARMLAAGRLKTCLASPGASAIRYNPLGYETGGAGDRRQAKEETRDRILASRGKRLAAEARLRLDEPDSRHDG